MICSLHRNDLEASGLTEETITAAGLRCADATEVRSILKFDAQCGGLVFEYAGTNGAGPAFTRVKPDHPFLDRYGKPSKYLSPKGAGNRLYIPKGVGSVLPDHKTPLWITEGEKKALRAVQDGLHCIAIPGVWSWRQRSTSRRSIPIPDLDLVTWKGRTVFLVFDSDLRDNRQVATALYELSRELERRGATVSKVDLPDGPKGEKVGLDDYLVGHSVETLCEIEPSPVLPPEFAYIEIVPATEFIHRKLPERESIIGRGILDPRSKAGLTGPGKSAKSMLLQNIVLSLSAGIPFLGFPIPKPKRTVYIQSEVSPYAMQRRLHTMIQSRRDEQLCFSDALLVTAPNLKIDRREGMRTIRHIIEQSQAEVVAFDPLYRLHNSDENKAEQMRPIMDLFEELIADFGVSVLIVHHHGKGIEGKTDGQLSRGSTVFPDWVDTQMVIRTKGTTSDQRSVKRLSFVLRNDAEPDPMSITLDPTTLWFRPADDEMEAISETKADRALEAAQRIFNSGEEVTAKSMEKTLAVSTNTAKDHMRMLSRFGWEEYRGKFNAIAYRPRTTESLSGSEPLMDLTGLTQVDSDA